MKPGFYKWFGGGRFRTPFYPRSLYLLAQFIWNLKLRYANQRVHRLLQSNKTELYIKTNQKRSRTTISAGRGTDRFCPFSLDEFASATASH